MHKPGSSSFYPPRIHLPPPSLSILSALPHEAEPRRLGFVPGAHPPPPPRKCANACTNPAHFHFTLLEYTSLHPLHPFMWTLPLMNAYKNASCILKKK